jgi:hypothetical protein
MTPQWSIDERLSNQPLYLFSLADFSLAEETGLPAPPPGAPDPKGGHSNSLVRGGLAPPPVYMESGCPACACVCGGEICDWACFARIVKSAEFVINTRQVIVQRRKNYRKRDKGSMTAFSFPPSPVVDAQSQSKIKG